jgi:hypothetical protein
MHRMMLQRTFLILATFSVAMFGGRETANAQPPRAMQQYDLEASGYVMPASGVAPEGAFVPPVNAGVIQAGGASTGFGGQSPSPSMPTNPSMANGVMPVGFLQGSSACDSCPTDGGYAGYSTLNGYGYADGYGMTGGCETGCGCGAAGMGPAGGCGQPGCCLTSACRGGVLGRLVNGERGGLRSLCLFCRGAGCEACSLWQPGTLIGMIGSLRPYADAGKCSQRWYDLSAEALFLGHNARIEGGTGGVISTQGVNGTPVLRLSDLDAGDLEAGMRFSAALICGPGGSIEGTYLGGQEWNSSASTSRVATQTIVKDRDGNVATPDDRFRDVTNPNDLFYSFLSDFGTNPPASTQPVAGNPAVTIFNPGGFDDTDASEQHSLTHRSVFHSAEINYRRRTVGPYCRFQGSWLAGVRYMRFDNDFGFSAVGNNNNALNSSLRFFQTDNSIDNSMLGGQAGFDLWYNMVPGINMGIATKLGFLHNDVDQRLSGGFNSAGPLATAGFASTSQSQDETGAFGEFEWTLLYRLTHSWTFKTSYYMLAIDEVASAGFDEAAVRSIATSTQPVASPLQFDSLVLQGFGFGAEYTW